MKANRPYDDIPQRPPRPEAAKLLHVQMVDEETRIWFDRTKRYDRKTQRVAAPDLVIPRVLDDTQLDRLFVEYAGGRTDFSGF